MRSESSIDHVASYERFTERRFALGKILADAMHICSPTELRCENEVMLPEIDDFRQVIRNVISVTWLHRQKRSKYHDGDSSFQPDSKR